MMVGRGRLAAWYFFYFAAAGVFLPYFSAYLLARGFDARAVGALMAALTVTKVLTPWLWGYAADRTGSRKRVVCVASAGAFLGFTVVIGASGFWAMLGALMLFSFFWQGALPQFEALTLSRLGDRAARYAQVRLWGSVGYVAAVMGVGAWLEKGAMTTVPTVVLAGLGLVALAAFAVPADPAPARAAAHPGGAGARGRPSGRAWLAAFFLSSIAMHASHGAYYAFFTPFLLEGGYRPASIGAFWAFGVVCEIVLFAFAHRWLERYAAERLLLLCFAVAAARWGLTPALAGEPALLAGLQALHAVTFGLHHALAMHLLRRAYRDRHLGRGQALYASLTFGIGSAIGSLGAGFLWDAFGAAAVFLGAAGVAGCGAVVVRAWVWPGLARSRLRSSPAT